MKKTLLLLILLASIQLFSQIEENLFKDCETAKKTATKDFKNGKFYYTIYNPHLDENINYEFEIFYQNYLYSKYSIEAQYLFCLTSKEVICYDKKMKSLIEKKFGKELLRDNRENVLILFNKIKNKSQILDFNKVYSTLESYAKYIGNDKKLMEFIKQNIDYKKVNEGYILLTVNRNNIIEHIEIKGIVVPDDLIEKVNSFGKFICGYLYGEKVKSKVLLTFENNEYLRF